MNSDWEVVLDGVVYQWFAALDENGKKMVELVEVID
tara:strand:- start:396 stop:503 length:108 start_codon:yes stop_codon:yes gene_type:complete